MEHRCGPAASWMTTTMNEEERGRGGSERCRGRLESGHRAELPGGLGSLYPPCGRRKIILSDEGKMYGRQRADRALHQAADWQDQTRKQVSSHIQVLARRKTKEVQTNIKDPATKEKAMHSLSQLSSAQIRRAWPAARRAPGPGSDRSRVFRLPAAAHIFAHINCPMGQLPESAIARMESVDQSQIADKFPAKRGPTTSLTRGRSRRPSWSKSGRISNTTLPEDHPGNMYESQESMNLSFSTKVCSFGKQVVEKVEKHISPHSENGKYIYQNERIPMCEYMINFISKLRQLPEKFMMNSVLSRTSLLCRRLSSLRSPLKLPYRMPAPMMDLKDEASVRLRRLSRAGRLEAGRRSRQARRRSAGSPVNPSLRLHHEKDGRSSGAAHPGHAGSSRLKRPRPDQSGCQTVGATCRRLTRMPTAGYANGLGEYEARAGGYKQTESHRLLQEKMASDQQESAKKAPRHAPGRPLPRENQSPVDGAHRRPAKERQQEEGNARCTCFALPPQPAAVPDLPSWVQCQPQPAADLTGNFRYNIVSASSLGAGQTLTELGGECTSSSSSLPSLCTTAPRHSCTASHVQQASATTWKRLPAAVGDAPAAESGLHLNTASPSLLDSALTAVYFRSG
uniref:TEA domain-containing protein n=1 Tax=Macrostomum lignano TaxID=282301 RepID=A0A1I8F339_9PLAT